MEDIKRKARKGNFIIQTWKRCKLLGSGSKRTSTIVRSSTLKSKSWPRINPPSPLSHYQDLKRHRSTETNSCNTPENESSGSPRRCFFKKNKTNKDEQEHARKRRVAPEGCFSVYVGPEKQRFVIKAEYANHPLFKLLLEEAELEYGYNSEGPLALPCKVDVFYKMLMALDAEDDDLSHGRFCFCHQSLLEQLSYPVKADAY